MSAYYNEFDPGAAAWLRELITQGHIAPGDVDERSIEDVTPSDLAGYAQCHFFAGIGVWSYALRCAGWPDDRPIWTGSCPCQPFSAAGKGAGIADERHLWPALDWLIKQCRPGVVFGEQVASKDGLAWLDIVSADLEGAGYAIGALDTCAAGFGAPHIRQRLYWAAEDLRSAASGLADARRAGDEPLRRPSEAPAAPGSPQGEARKRKRGGLANSAGGALDGLADAHDAGPQGRLGMPERAGQRALGAHGMAGGLEHPTSGSGSAEREQRGGEHGLFAQDGSPVRAGHSGARSGAVTRLGRPGPTNGHWRNADWLFSRDGKWRAVRPGTFPLAHGATARVGRLRGYGNAIVAPQAAAFIEAYLETRSRPVRVSAQPLEVFG